MTGPLQGYTILELTAERGAFCGRMLADLGADVIKVEPPEGEQPRRQPPFKGDVPDPEGSLRFASLNANKRGITLNLHEAAGKERFLKLLGGADGLLDDCDPRQLDALGLGHEAMLAVNPSLVHTSITGFGLSGPHSEFKGPDIVGFAMGGLLGISGEPDRPPCMAPETMAFYRAGMNAALGTVMALFARGMTGEGQLVEISVQECLAAEEHQIVRHSLDGHVVRREGSQHGSASPGRIYPCKDGYIHFYIAGGWQEFLEWMGSPDALCAEAWQQSDFRRANVDVLNPYVEAFAFDRPNDQLAREGQERHLAVAPVNSPADLADDPQMAALGFFQEADHPALGRSPYAGPPWTFSETPASLERAAPTLGQDNEDILGEL